MYDALSKICQPGAKQLLESTETPSSDAAHARVLCCGTRMLSGGQGVREQVHAILSTEPSYSSEAMKVTAYVTSCVSNNQGGRFQPLLSCSLSSPVLDLCPGEASALSGSLSLTRPNSNGGGEFAKGL